MTASIDVPDRMKAEVLDEFGPPEVIHTSSVPVPEVGAHEVLIRVGTAGVGAWEPHVCAGQFDPEALRQRLKLDRVFGAEGSLPGGLGSDGAGTIAAKGADASRFHPGDAVYGWGFLNPKGGFYAEYVALSEDEVSTIPPNLSLEQAGVLAVDGLTALAGIDRLLLGPDRTLLVTGASGGVGHLAVQLARRLEARVFAVASGEDGVELVRRLGANDAVDGRSDEAAAKARAFAPGGFDAALLLTGARLDEMLALLREGGRGAYPNGVVGPEPRRGIDVEAFDGYHGREALERLGALVGKGPFDVIVSRVYPLEDTPQALRDVKKHHLGKLAVRVQ
jgi:NADPH2:quinone reductase